MSQRTVEFVELERLRFPVTFKDCFSFNPNRPLPWLQRIAIWTLRRLGCCHTTEHETVKRDQVNPDTILKSLFKQEHAAREFANGADIAFIGAEDFAEFTQSEAPDVVGILSAEYYRGRREILGLQIIVVPWMRGVFVPPFQWRKELAPKE